MTNYTITDTIHVLLAFVLFAPCVVFPGYALGWISDVLMFRARTLAEKFLLAVPLSVAVSPLLIYLTGLVSMRLAWATLGLAAILFAVFLIRDLIRRERLPLRMGGFLALAATWLVIGLLSLVDYQWGEKLYTPTTSWDYTTRVAITDAITRTGVAPVNPFFFPGYTFPLRYHYFWMLPASIVDQLGGDLVTPAQATLAGTLWSGLALMATVVLYVWYFQGGGLRLSKQRALIGVALLVVTGLDIMPMLFHLLMFNHVPYTVDSWNELIAGWVSSVLWVPHHVAAVVACLTGFLVLWTGATRRSKQRNVSAIVAGAAFACSAGLSIYVCFVFAAALLLFGVIALLKRWRNDVIAVALSGAVAVILAFPYLSRTASAVGAAAGSFAVFKIRSFSFPENLLVAFHAPEVLIGAVNFLLLPINYGMELGLLFLVAIVQSRRLARRRRPLNRREWAEIALITGPVLICTFFRSGVISQNDLGWRGFLIPQFILLLWSVDYLRVATHSNAFSPAKDTKLARLITLVVLAAGLGVTGTLYGLLAGRAFLPLLEAGLLRQAGNWYWTPDLNIGKRMLSQRNAVQWIQTHVPPNATVLDYPGEQQNLWTGLYGNHQRVASDQGCGSAFGGTLELCKNVLADVQPLFSITAPIQPDFGSLCPRYSIGAILVQDTDPVWSNRQSWVWMRHPAYENQYSKVFVCPRDLVSRRF